MVVKYADAAVMVPTVSPGTGALKFDIDWPNAPTAFQTRDASTEAKQSPVHMAYYIEGPLLLTAYAAFADRFMQPYTGPDEAPAFEPEDLPLH